MSPLWESGLELTLLGMGTVFVFLVLLIIATMSMSKILLAIENLSPPQTSTPTPVKPVANNAEEQQLVAVAAAAYQLHQQHNK